MMMDRPLLISQLVAYSAAYHRDAEIVSRAVEGGIHRYRYPDLEARAKCLAKALQRHGVRLGDRVATLAWNSYRHLELYFGISGMGAICHTINPRLFHDQLRYIVNHAEDKLVFLDLTFVPLVEKLAAEFKPVRHYVVMTDRAHMPQTSLPNLLCYEDLLAGADSAAEAHQLFYDEYLSVMDMPAEFYLQTVQSVFQDFDLAQDRMVSRERPVVPSLITRTALMAVEGERDDIIGIGQTEAAQTLCSSLPDSMRRHLLQPGVGHYGVFSGRRWRNEIMPEVRDFIRAHDRRD